MKGRLFLNGQDLGEVEIEQVTARDAAHDEPAPALTRGVTEVTVTGMVSGETALRALLEAFVNAPGGRA